MYKLSWQASPKEADTCPWCESMHVCMQYSKTCTNTFSFPTPIDAAFCSKRIHTYIHTYVYAYRHTYIPVRQSCRMTNRLFVTPIVTLTDDEAP